MRKIFVLLTMVLAAVVLPTIAIDGQATDPVTCDNGVLVAGRCLSVDLQATICDGDACLEFVEESVAVCPDGTTEQVGPVCELVEPATQRPVDCPDGARGEAGDCFIYVAVGPQGCPTGSNVDSANECRKPVADARGAFFCERENAQLFGAECRSTLDQEPSPCPAGTVRFDSACWRMNGLTSPESCAGHGDGTVELTSGLCQVPVAIVEGAAACADGAVYYEHPSYVAYLPTLEVVAEGPLEDGCVDDSVSLGNAIQGCFFFDDDFDWFDVVTPESPADGVCERFAEPLVQVCPTGFSRDDSLGGLCARWEPVGPDGCPANSNQNGQSCVFTAEFADFQCPAGTERFSDRAICFATRPMQLRVFCSSSTLRVPSSEPNPGPRSSCFARVGPQPGVCNGIGTVDDCFNILEPIAVPCGAATGCVALGNPPSETMSCNGLAATHVVTPGETLYGTDGADVIVGTDGKDVIYSGAGSDTICSLGGNDFVVAGNGADLVFAGLGVDTVYAQDGDDTVHGEGGTDYIHGGDGNDTVFAGSGPDRVWAGAGADVVNGMGGQDQIWGGPGNDRLQGNWQSDRIWGGPGDDRLAGAEGRDKLYGEEGNDDLFGGNNYDYLDGGPGTDFANGQRGRDRPVIVDERGCIAETTLSC